MPDDPRSEERHPAGYDYRVRFPRLRLVVAAEGGVVYAADGPEGAALVSDEGALSEWLDEKEYGGLVTVRLFASAAARDAYAVGHWGRAVRTDGPPRPATVAAQRGDHEFLVAAYPHDLAPALLVDARAARVSPVRHAGMLLKHGHWDDVVAPASVRRRVRALAAPYAYLLQPRAPMPTVFVPTRSAEDWRPLLAQPERHWKAGYSAMSLARAWEAAPGDFPPEVRAVLEWGNVPALAHLRLLLALPEYPIALPGGTQPSHTDVLALARGPEGLVAVAVEGKVDEPFGPTLDEQRAGASPGAAARLAYLLEVLGLTADAPDALRYQLLHRAVSALLAAEQFAAPTAVLLVQSFSPSDRGLDDFGAFVGRFGQPAAPGALARLGRFGGRELYAGWCRGDQHFRAEPA